MTTKNSNPEQGLDRFARSVPRGVHGTTWIQLGLGGWLPQIGWFLVLMATLFFWLMPKMPESRAADALLIPLLVGLGIVTYSLNRGRRQLRLARWGYLTGAERLSCEATDIRIGGTLKNPNSGKPVYQVIFSFQDHLGQEHRATVYTPFPEPILDNEREQILFDPEDPSVSALVDALPGDVKIDFTGQIRTQDDDLAWMVLVLPVLTLLSGVPLVLLWF